MAVSNYGCSPLVMVVLLLSLSFAPIKAEITLYQKEQSSLANWTVEGLASYDVGGCCSTTFDFICLSNPPTTLTWFKEGGSLGKTQIAVNSGGVLLRFSSPTEADAGIYGCRDTSVQFSVGVRLNITTVSPIVRAINSTLSVIQGEPVTIGFYAARLKPLYPSNITWRLNNDLLEDGNFDSLRRRLYISSAQQSDAGTYKLAISGGHDEVASDAVTLTVLTPPTFITHPLNSSDISEWTSFNVTCSVRADKSFVINWYKLNGTLPSNVTITNTTNGNIVTSTLTVYDARVSDSGSYICNSSFIDGTYPATSNTGIINIKASIRFLYSPTGSSPFFPSSPLLFTSSLNFNIECQSSGNLEWVNMGGAPITSDTSVVPYQEMFGSFVRLVFNGQFEKSLYRCVNNDGNVMKELYISNDNPAIFSPNSTYRVGNTTMASLIIYVGGDPAPLPSNITWYFNDGPLMSNHGNGHYQLTEGNTRLLINAPSSDVTGSYRVAVVTSQGSANVLFNVTYFDPPIITLSPSLHTKTLSLGESFTINCNVTSPLDTTINWLYNDGDALPMSVVISEEGEALSILSAGSSHAGVYECVVSDGLSQVKDEIVINVIYGPTVDLDSPNMEIVQEGSNGRVITCQGGGYPNAELTWSFNGSNQLPAGVKTSLRRGGSRPQLLLYWTRTVLYSDEGTYYCTASNSYNTSTDSYKMNVNATPMIYSIYPEKPSTTVTLTTTTPTFGCPSNSSSSCLIICIARGWPAPSLFWIDTSGRVTNSFVTRESGVVMVGFNWNSSLPLRYRCEARNTYGSTTQNINLVAVETPKPTLSIPPFPTVTGNVLKLRLRLLTSDCSDQSDPSIRRNQLQVALTQVMLSGCQSCSNNVMITIPQSSCGNTTTGATIFSVHVQDVLGGNSLMPAYQTLAQWWATSPTLLLSVGNLYRIDNTCNLIVDNNDELSCSPITSATPTSVFITPTLSPTSSTGGLTTLEIFWSVVVGIIVVLCLIVGSILIIVICFCVRSCRGQKKGKDIGSSFDMSTLRSYRSSNTRSSFASSLEIESPFNNGSHHHPHFPHLSTSSESIMFDNPEYMQNQLIEEVRRASLSRESAQHRGTNRHVLQTTPTDEIDAPPTKVNRNNSVTEVTVRNTPIQEILYQEATPSQTAPTNNQEENVYDKIRQNAKRAGSPPYMDPPDFPGKNSLTLPRSPPSSPQYTEPTPPLMHRQKGLSTPSLGPPLPYSLPVSSHRDINKIPPNLLQRTTSVPHPQLSHNRVGGGSRGHLPAVRENGHAHQNQPWWYNNADGDITTPTQTNFGYASTSSSRVGGVATPLSRADSGLSMSPVSRQGSGSVIVTPLSPGVTMYEV